MYSVKTGAYGIEDYNSLTLEESFAEYQRRIKEDTNNWHYLYKDDLPLMWMPPLIKFDVLSEKADNLFS